MYSRKVTSQAIAATETRLGIQLVHHPLSYLEGAIAHFNALMTDEGLKRPLDIKEREFLRNERLLCKLDYNYWRSSYCWIKHYSENRYVRYEPNTAQRMMNDICAEMEEEGIAIFIQQLKARQLGVTTDTETRIAHRVQFYQNVNAVVASSRPEKSEEMSDKMSDCWARQPWWLLPRQTVGRAGSLIEFGDLNSFVSIQHGAQLTGIARGTTPNCIHLCLAPHTLIHTENGTLKPISEVREGDVVITHSGALSNVRAVCKSGRRDELASEVWLWGNFAPLSCTRDHPVLTPAGWIPAKDIAAGSHVLMPVRKIERTITQSVAEQDKYNVTHKNAPAQSYPCNRAWGWLLGLYLAEGSIQSRKHAEKVYSTALLFSIDVDEVESFTVRLKEALGNVRIAVRRSNSRTRILCVNNAILARWVRRNFGVKGTKHVPDWVWNAGREFCLGIVEGYLDGDGHYVKDSNEAYASSVRVQLPVQMRDLIASLDFGWSAIQYKQAGIYYERNCQAQWTLVICGNTGRRLRQALNKPAFEEAGHSHWQVVPDSPYIAIEVFANHDGFSKEFYDLEVDHRDHSFVTAQCAVKNSELCEFENPKELVDASLMRAVHHSPFTFFVMESTALGEGNWWHDTWLLSKEGWPSRTADFRPVFLPWFIGSDIYPDDIWLRAHPIPPDWAPAELSLAHRARCESFVCANDLLSKHLGSSWHLPDRQLWWWEVQRNISVRKKELAQFYMETPGDDIEAFQSTTTSVFDTDTIQVLRENERVPVAVFGFVGHSDYFPLRNQPAASEIDSNLPPIHIKARMSPDQTPIECDLVPLRFNGYPTFNEMGKLLLWEMPEDGEEYGIGVDTSEGVGQDRSVMEVLRKASYYRNAAFAAEFASPRMNSLDIFPYAFVLGHLFSTNSIDGGLRRPRFVIECRWNGENVQLELQKKGWPNFHKWTRYHKTKYNLAQERNIGWYMNQWSRPMMMDYFCKAIRDGYLESYSPYFVDELRHLVSDEGFQDARATYEYHDDRCMAGGIVFFSLHVFELEGTMRPMRDHRLDQVATQPYPTYQHSWQSRDEQDVSGADIYLSDEDSDG